MKKTIYISFQDSTARIYINQVPPPEYPFIKDPDLKKGRGVPMHKWYPELFEEPAILRLNRLYGVQFVVGGLAMVGVFALLLAAFKSILGAL